MQAILFDWDGTLVDSLGAFHRANATVMASFGLPFDEVLYRRHYVPDWRLMYRRLGVPGDRLDEANELWHATFATDGDDVIAFDGVAGALGRLRDAGKQLGIVTAGHRAIVVPQLERTGLAELLTTRVFGDDLAVHKPDPAPLRMALELLDLADRPDEVAYVGDAPTDMQMARAVGVRAVGITSVIGDPGELRAAGAAEVAPSVVAWVDDIPSRRRSAGRRHERRDRFPVSSRRARRRAIVLADGDVAERAAFDAAWPGWSDGVAIVVAADGGARHAARPRPADSPLGRRRRLDRRGGPGGASRPGHPR